MIKLKNKVAVIVGGASDLATAAGKRFAEDGATVVLIHHNQSSLERVLPAYEGKKIETHLADVRDYAQLKQAFDAVSSKHGAIDIMINCAAVLKPSPIDMLSGEDWQSVIDVNLTGAFHACKAAVPIMKTRNSGRIINVSSLAGRTGRPGVGVNYAASKAGMIGLTQALARELAPWGITANVVAPGPLKGRMFMSLAPETREKLQSGIPLGRVGEMDEVAGAILFFAGDDAAWITGEVLDVNGGIYM